MFTGLLLNNIIDIMCTRQKQDLCKSQDIYVTVYIGFLLSNIIVLFKRQKQDLLGISANVICFCMSKSKGKVGVFSPAGIEDILRQGKARKHVNRVSTV